MMTVLSSTQVNDFFFLIMNLLLIHLEGNVFDETLDCASVAPYILI